MSSNGLLARSILRQETEQGLGWPKLLTRAAFDYVREFRDLFHSYVYLPS
jgi:hypothetical protein